MPALTREDVDSWGLRQLSRVLPYAYALRGTPIEQLREMVWVEIQKREIDEMDKSKSGEIIL